jgi:hypothetical protein
MEIQRPVQVLEWPTFVSPRGSPSVVWLDQFEALAPAAQLAQLQARGGPAFTKKALSLALSEDRPSAVDALRHTAQAFAVAQPRAAAKLGRAYCDRALAEKAWRQGKYAIAVRQPQTGFELTIGNKISGQCFIHGFADAAAVQPYVEQLLTSGLLQPEQYLQGSGCPEDQALQLTLQGCISVEMFLQHTGYASPTAMAALVAAGRLAAERWLRHGNMLTEPLMERLERGEWTALFCVRTGWVPEALVAQWVGQGLMAPHTFMVAMQPIWEPKRILSPTMVQFASSYPTHEALVAGLGSLCRVKDSAKVFAPSDTLARNARRRMLANRLLAARLQGEAAYTAVAGAAPNGEAPTACSVCYEPAAPDALHKPAACGHSADLCGDCMVRAVSTAVHQHCLTPGCRTPLTPDDLLRFGCSVEAADALAKKIIHGSLVQTGTWVACHTEDCFGGIHLPQGETLEYTCGGCQRVQTGAAFVADIEANRTALLHLVENLGPNGKTRECPHCGLAQTHTGGCAAMHCAATDKYWHLDLGKDKQNRNYGTRSNGGQSYVPMTGLLVRSGLYAGFTPGQSGIDPERLRQVVSANALEKGLILDGQAIE